MMDFAGVDGQKRRNKFAILVAKFVKLDKLMNSVKFGLSAQRHRKLNPFFFGETQPEPTL